MPTRNFNFIPDRAPKPGVRRLLTTSTSPSIPTTWDSPGTVPVDPRHRASVNRERHFTGGGSSDPVLRYASNPASTFLRLIAAIRKWMEAIPKARTKNGSMDREATGEHNLGLDTNTSPQQTHLLSSPISSPVTTPPYWVSSHQRSFSNISVESVPTGAITLRDNTDCEDAKGSASWAKSVYIEDHVVVNERRTTIGAFVVWNITVETLRGSSFRIRKRYSEFDDLRTKLLKTFPNSQAALPPLPPKSVISKFRPKFLEQRRVGLQYFFNCILLNPEFSGSPIVKEFLFE